MPENEIVPHCVVEILDELLVPLEMLDISVGNIRQDAFTFYKKGKEISATIKARGRYSLVPFGRAQIKDRDWTAFTKVKYPLGQKFAFKPDQPPSLKFEQYLQENPQPVQFFDTMCGRIIALFETLNAPLQLQCTLITDSKSNWPNTLFPVWLNDLTAIDTPPAITVPQCTCDTKILFATGCICGFLKKRKFGI